MSHAWQRKELLFIAAIGLVCVTADVGLTRQASNIPGGSQGPLADSCGVPAPAAGGQSQAGGARIPVFPPSQYPV